jgi:hypothetical protein
MSCVAEIEDTQNPILYCATELTIREFAHDNWGRDLTDDEVLAIGESLCLYDSDFLGTAIHRVIDKPFSNN